MAISSFVILSGNNGGKGSTPISSGTDDFSVDVCINQECDYVADGQSDEREIKAAITAVLAAGGGKVNIRTGNYDISSPVEFSLSGESLIIEGDGLNTKLTNSMTDSSAGGTSFVATGLSSTSADKLIFKDMAFVGTANSGAGVSLVNIYDAKIEGCKFSSFSASGNYGVAITTSGVIGITINDNLFVSNTKNINIGDESTLLSYSAQGNVGIGVSNPQQALTLSNNNAFAIELNVPTDGSAATTTGGTLSAGTYYFKITTLDGEGGQSLPSDEFSCSASASNKCIITWTDVVGDSGKRLWVATTSETYYGYYTATTSASYTMATSTSLVAGTMPTKQTAYLTKFATSSDSWITSGQLGLGTSTPEADLSFNSTGNSTSTVQFGKLCWEVIGNNTTTKNYIYYNGNDLATSSVSCF